MSTERWTWRLEDSIPSDIAACNRVIELLLRELEELGWYPHDIFSVHLALEEALVNAVKHGNRLDSTKRVHVVCKLAPDRLWLQVTDEGAGFDPHAVPDPTLPDRIDLPSGRGLLLMRTYMSSVEYSKDGRTVTMEKVRAEE